jgi:hypothetical protein
VLAYTKSKGFYREGGMAEDVNPWQLERQHETFTKSNVQRGNTEHIQFRADAFHVRRIDEIIASRVDPSFKTRSDVLSDAVVLWLENWDLQHPDGTAGELHHRFQLDNQKRARQYRVEYMESAKEELDALRKDFDVEGLRALSRNLIAATIELTGKAPPKYIAELDQLLAETRRLLDPK